MGKKKAFISMLGKVSKDVVSTSSTVAVALPVAEQMTSEIIAYLNKKHEDEKDMVAVPDICAKDIALTLAQAEELLTKSNLTVMAVKTPMSEAGVKYKDCFDSQVVAYHNDGKGKVEPGSTVRVKYITQDVIDESKRLFDEREKEKERKRLEKDKKRAAGKKKRDEFLGEASDSFKKQVSKISLFGKKEEK